MENIWGTFLPLPRGAAMKFYSAAEINIDLTKKRMKFDYYYH